MKLAVGAGNALKQEVHCGTVKVHAAGGGDTTKNYRSVGDVVCFQKLHKSH